MKASPRPRKTANLSESIHHQLNTYALAAGAAGVSVLALSPPGEAKIVYTAAHHVIKANQTYPLDLNHDGTPDFELKNIFNTFSGNSAGFLWILPHASANEVWAAARAPYCGTRRVCAAALPIGKGVGPKGPFRQDYPDGEIMVETGVVSGHYGSWFNVTRYLGLKFVIKGKTHYGWARLAVSAQRFVVTATLTRYAYETVPGKRQLSATIRRRPTDKSEPIQLEPNQELRSEFAIAGT